MQTTLDNKKKAAIESPRSVLKRTTKTEEGGALGSGLKRNRRAQKQGHKK
jgi:hypothetical protein